MFNLNSSFNTSSKYFFSILLSFLLYKTIDFSVFDNITGSVLLSTIQSIPISSYLYSSVIIEEPTIPLLATEPIIVFVLDKSFSGITTKTLVPLL